LISVLVVVEVRLYREAVARVLREQHDVSLEGEADSVRHARLEVERTRPDIVLLDLGTAGALDLVRVIRMTVPHTRVVAMGFGGTDAEAVAAAEAGLSGYIGIHQPLDDVVAAIRAVMSGEAPCDGRITAALLRRLAAGSDEPRCNPLLDDLTARERLILELLSGGLSNKEIANQLVIGVATVKSHVHAILRKLEVSRRGAAAELFRRSQAMSNGSATQRV
jgi:two-component system, NarL family, nitrate/nitrite response regulator NarL